MITREQLDESLERFMKSLLFEIKQSRDHLDMRFREIEARLDRQAGLMLRFGRKSEAADESQP
jgi:hypothetical protein